MGLFNFLGKIVNKFKNKISSIFNKPISSGVSQNFIFGTIIQFKYLNYKKDPNPMVLVLYSGLIKRKYFTRHYTIGINLNNLTYADQMYIINKLLTIRKGNIPISPIQLFQEIKFEKPKIIQIIPKGSFGQGYRSYHTSFISGYYYLSPGLFRGLLPLKFTNIEFYKNKYPLIYYINNEIFGGSLEAKNTNSYIDNQNNVSEIVNKRAELIVPQLPKSTIQITNPNINRPLNNPLSNNIQRK